MSSLSYHLTVSDLAREADVTADTVRYYTRIGLLKPRRNSKNSYQLYANSEVGRLRFIRKAKMLGYTLKDIDNILAHANSGKSPCPLVRNIIEQRIVDNREKLGELIELQSRMEKAASSWRKQTDKVPDGNSICHLIESFTHD